MIYVVRHGQTDLNKEGRLQGRKGLPLNEVGLRQAETLRTRLDGIDFDFVYSSPQGRAVQTAEVATNRKAIIDSRLDVYDLGEADNLRRSEVQLEGITPDPQVYHGVEEIEEFMNRVFDFMKNLEEKYTDKDVNILISGHRCTTGCIGAYFNGIPEDRNILKYSSDNGDYKTYDFK